jgi:apolipoprotein N-acyltransferase|tara:strand:+ start:1455 stop:2990 length:1536 start_codon:yes stop_codon:yes gene_type:complete
MRKIFLATLSGLFLAFSWPEIGMFPLIFFAFIPLLVLENQTKNGKQVFWHSFLAFFIFNAVTTYWIYHATLFGAIAAFLINATLMATAFYLFHRIKRGTNNRIGNIAFVVLWIAMEYFHLNWELSWPWLTLGNVFANYPSLVQWYEFTGFLGGSFWVLSLNLLGFQIIQAEKKQKAILFSLLILVLPMCVSNHLFLDFKNPINETTRVVIAQPNINPYTDKFNVGYEKQLDDFMDLVKPYLNQETKLLIGPETALLEGIWENKIEATYSISEFRKLQNEFPNLNIIVGASTYKIFENGEKKTKTAREIRNENIFYDAYNSAIFIPDSGKVKVYHKTKLVPGVEKMPFPKLLDKFAEFATSLGGISGSLGSENKTNLFLIGSKKIKPLICYESIYGDLKSDESDIIAVITNDGWWKNTAGYQQHFAYTRLRAIEKRRTIIRSANTGVSGVINPKGEVLEKTNWNEAICISTEVRKNETTTFYSLYGDFIGRLSTFFSAIFLIVAFVKGKLKK